MPRALLLLSATAIAFGASSLAQDVLPSGDADGQQHLGSQDQLGWTVIPSPLSEIDPSRMTELERLSVSPSGVTFGLEGYDAREDNPLEPVSVTLRALDKITATYQDIEIPIGEEAVFGPLTLLPRTCDKRPPEETPETTVFLEVFTSATDEFGRRSRQTRTAMAEAEGPASDAALEPATLAAGSVEEDAARQRDLVDALQPVDPTAELIAEDGAVFRGWMFASSPSLNGMEHPVYDVWVIDCKMIDPRT